MDEHIATHTGITKNHKKNPIPKRGEGYNSNSAKNAYLWRNQFKKSEINRVEASCKVVLEKLGYANFENILAASDVLQKKFHEVFLEWFSAFSMHLFSNLGIGSYVPGAMNNKNKLIGMKIFF